MRLVSNQPTRLYGTAKTHKLGNISDITSTSIKFRSIIDQTGFHTFNAAKVISVHRRPLCKNVYTITETQSFPQHFANLNHHK